MKDTGNLESNKYLFNMLDRWIDKYETSPKGLTKNNQDNLSLSIALNEQTQELLKNPDYIAELKNWAIKHKKVVIISGTFIIVFTVSAIGMLLHNSYLESLEVEENSFRLSKTRASASKITTGVYYASKSNEILSEEDLEFLAMEEDNQQEEPPLTSPEIIIEDESEPTAELLPSEDPTSSTEAITQIDINNLSGSNGVEIVIPSYVVQTGLCRNYTSYTYFYGRWGKGSGQRALSEQWGAAGKPSSNGIATLNGRYLVAVSPKFGSVGDHIDIVLSDGQVIPATIADAKGRDATSEWGHVLITRTQAVDIIEWEATGAKSEINLGSWANVTVDRIINYGKEIIPVYEEEKQVVINAEAEQYIQLYSEIYGLNGEKIYEIISGSTNNFSSESYEQYNIIETFGDSRNISCRSKEMAILLAVRDIYHNPSYYGVTAQEIRGNTLYYSASSYANQIEYLSNVLGVDSDLNYAICQAACDFSSPMFKSKNNPTSIMINGDYATFPTVTAGFLEQTVELLEIILSGGDPIKTIGDRNGVSETWNADATEIYNYVTNNYEVIFGASESSQVLKRKVSFTS